MSASERTGEYDKFVADAFNHFADLRAELEATRAELAAERAKPKGVAWALMDKVECEFVRFMFADIIPLFSSQFAACQYIDAHAKRNQWYVVAYPIGDGADELKAAIERAEKAESEVAAWKEAANFSVPLVIESPIDLAKRLADLDEWLENAKQTIAALKAAPAEVPPLDKWRVLATAVDVTCDISDTDQSSLAVVCDIATSLISRVLAMTKRLPDAKPYPLKD